MALFIVVVTQKGLSKCNITPNSLSEHLDRYPVSHIFNLYLPLQQLRQLILGVSDYTLTITQILQYQLN